MKTGEQNCLCVRTTAVSEAVSNDLPMKLGGGGDKVRARVCTRRLESRVVVSPTLIALAGSKYTS